MWFDGDQGGAVRRQVLGPLAGEAEGSGQREARDDAHRAVEPAVAGGVERHVLHALAPSRASDDLAGRLDDLVDVEPRGVELDGVVGAPQRRHGALRVVGVARHDGAQRLVDADVLAAGDQLAAAALGADLGRGRQEELDGRRRKHDGADVAALDHDVLGGPDAALLLEQHGAHLGVRRDLGDRGRHGRPPDLLAHVAVGGHDAAVGGEREAGLASQGGQRGAVVGGHPVAQRQVGDGAVHGAGVEVGVAEARRRAAGRACSCPSRPDRR